MNSQIQKKTAAVCTMGCKVNSYESEAMTELLKQDGYEIVDFSQKADVYLINTCTVTQIAARKSRQMIHRARALNPQSLIIAAGCYVDRDNSIVVDGVADITVPNRDKARILDYLHEHQMLIGEAAKDIVPNSLDEPKQLWITTSEGKTRVFLKVQDGCRQFCTYCIIPFVRGPLVSRLPEDCVMQTQKLAENGFKEIVITGIDVTMYGEDLKDKGLEIDMGDLILALSKVEGIERIRLGSLEPRVITPKFMEKIRKTDKLCPHFHLALQSGCDRTLKAMNRRYTTDEFRKAVQMLREYNEDVAITTDIIVGFPGETEEDHREALKFVEEIGFSEAHVFRYSKMEGTAAARRSDQIDGSVKKRRAFEMLSVAGKSSEAFMQKMQHRKVVVLLEQKDEASGCWTGYSDNYVKIGVRMPEDRDHQGEEVTVWTDGYIHISSANHDAAGVENILKGEYLA